MTTEQLKEWASKKRAELVLKHATPGASVIYGGGEYEVVGIVRGMVAIYDEPPSSHIDFINPRNLSIAPIKRHCKMCKQPVEFVRRREFKNGETSDVYCFRNASCANYDLYSHFP